MRNYRLYFAGNLQANATVMLDEFSSHHALSVLRLQRGDFVNVFNGEGEEAKASISLVKNKRCQLDIQSVAAISRESPLQIHLAQACLHSQKMDLVLQKSVELGVHAITPVVTERSQKNLAADRQAKRMRHWSQVIISASAQCQRNVLARLNPVISLADWLADTDAVQKILCHPEAEQSLRKLPEPKGAVAVLIGPEGGFSEKELSLAKSHDFQAVCLGPRVLRTETAAITLISAMQCLWGDLA